MSELTDLYQEVILDHNRRPRNFGVLPGGGFQAHGHNPLCGDKLTVTLTVEQDLITDIRFEGSGCAISKASASIMTEAVKGEPVSRALTLFERFQDLVTTPIEKDVDASDLGKLAVFSGIREFPMRVKCATLAWHTLRSALARSERASTE